MPSNVQRKLPVEFTKKLMSRLREVDGVVTLIGNMGVV